MLQFESVFYWCFKFRELSVQWLCIKVLYFHLCGWSQMFGQVAKAKILNYLCMTGAQTEKKTCFGDPKL